MLPVTEGSTTTRVADAITGAGSQALFSSVNSSGVLYAEIATHNTGGELKYIQLNDGSTNNRIILRLEATQIKAVYVLGGVAQASLTHTVSDITDFNKAAFRWAENDFSLWIDGVEVDTDVSGSVMSSGTLTNMDFSDPSGASPFYGKTKAIYVTEVLTDDELTSLTTP